MTNNFPDFITLLSQVNSILISGHINPDGDCTGTALACKQLFESIGKEVTVYSRDSYPYNFDFIKGYDAVSHELPQQDADLYIVVDAGAPHRVGDELLEHLQKTSSPIVLFDHHEISEQTQDFPYTLRYIDENAPATSVLIFRLAQEMGVEITTDFSVAVYAALLSDTGGFRYSKTTAESFRIAAELVDAGVSPWDVSSSMHNRIPLNAKRCTAEVMTDLQMRSDGKIGVIEIKIEQIERYGISPDLIDGIVNEVRSIDGVELAARFREEKSGVYKVSLRSIGRIDANAIALRFGGGGHKNAAGFTFEGSYDAGVAIIEEMFREQNK
ncbi:bifunctional oligoribonuclease/PAP phosphatase NrnA [bacterium]|nr:bifunctional oligoribonuclease/PAP phosphatase NrnA [bacterium]